MSTRTANRLILVNGPAGVGKTTIASALACRGRNSACISGDDLKHWIVNRVESEVEGGLGYKNGAAAAANYLRAGYDLVVFDYIFEHPRHVQRFIEHLGSDLPAEVFLFTLWAPREVVLAREQARPERERLGRRVEECYAAIEAELPRLGHCVNNNGATPDEIAEQIEALCDAGHGRIATQT